MRKLILTCVTLLLMAQSYAPKVIFPQAQQAGTATSSFSEDTYTLANDLLSATFIHADGKLTFGGCAAMGLLPSDDLFSIRLGNGTEVSSVVRWQHSGKCLPRSGHGYIRSVAGGGRYTH